MDFNYDWIGLGYKLVVSALPLIFAITVHEAAHAWMASVMGDNTAKQAGRVTINPIPHIDKIGTVFLPVLCLAFGLPVFGWAKPVPIDPSRMRYPRKSPFWVALAGPASNFIMALAWAMLGWVSTHIELNGDGALAMAQFINDLSAAGILINLALMIFNLLPLPPLDGARLVERFMNTKQRIWWHNVERYGIFIVMFLASTPVLTQFWFKPWMSAFMWLVNIPRSF